LNTDQINACVTNDHAYFTAQGISSGRYIYVLFRQTGGDYYPILPDFTINTNGSDYTWDQRFDFITAGFPQGLCATASAYDVPTGTYQVRLYDYTSWFNFINSGTPTTNYGVSSSYGGILYISTPTLPTAVPTAGPTATPPPSCSLAYCSQDTARCTESICVGCPFCGCPDNLLSSNEEKFAFCSSASVVPPSGPGNTSFTFEGRNCVNIGSASYYRMSIYDGNGLINSSTPQIYAVDADSDGQMDDVRASIALATFQNPGTFYAKLFAPYTDISGNPFVGAQCAPFGVTSPVASSTCCNIDPSSNPAAFCGPPLGCTNVGSNDPSLCPASCPPERFYCTSEVWVCMNRNACSGFFTGNAGTCRFARCPENMVFDGFNPPTNNDCPVLFACCTDPQPAITRALLNTGCTTTDGQQGINTAVGCIATTTNIQFLTFVLPWALGVAGGTSFILFIVSAVMFSTSAGDPQRIKSAKQLFWSALTGLIMIIFSVYLLNLIGLQILRLPGI